jgi:sialate O-acetylesterase
MKKLLFIMLLGAALDINAQVKLQPLFTDNMVLQQNSITPVWGKSKAGKKITLTTSWDKKKYETTADDNGNFEFKVNTPHAGGPFTLTFNDGRKTTLRNVMIGEVWLMGGQSNAQMQMYGIKDAEKEIADAANFPDIRLLQVRTTAAAKPSETLNAEGDGWEKASPRTVRNFSAAGYLFARELQKDRNVPIGIIQSCLGSTFAEAWISSKSLAKMPYFNKAIEQMEKMPADSTAREKKYAQDLKDWEKQVESMDGNSKAGLIVYEHDFADADKWSDIEVPGLFEDQKKDRYGAFDGIVWYRRTVDLPAEWEGKECKLCLGAVDDDDMTYFNGVLVGSHMGVAFNREYVIPASLVKAGKAEIAVRVHDTGGLGGFYSNDARIECGAEKVPITGTWKFMASIDEKDLPFYPTNLNTDTNVASALYNGMIAPLAPYKMKGVLWYQGESSVGRAYQYRELLPLLIYDWRTAFNQELQFYIVQLANHMTEQTDPAEESTWAELREAQMKTAHSVGNTALAVTIDIGEAADIHPKNKQEVGRRLSLIARAKAYGEKIEYSGPQYIRSIQEGGKIRLFFTHARGLKVGRGDSKLKGFAVAGPDRKFHWADAVIADDGRSVEVSSSEVPFPVSVRYGWANNPYCNLYNGDDLPASPFRTDEWPGLSINNY